MAPAPDSRPTAPAADEALAAPRRGFVAAGWAKFSDNAIPSLVVTVIVGLVIFSFNETSDRITRLKDDIDTRFTAVDARFTAVDARFTKLEDDIDARFTKLEDDIDARFTKLEDDIDARFTKLEDDIDARFTTVDARFTKLEENQHDIALTLARLVALFEAHDEAEATPSG